MEDKQLKLIREIQAIQKSIEDKMDEALPAILKDFSEKAIQIITDSKIDATDQAKSLRETIKLKNQLMDVLIATPAYQAEVSDVIKGFKELAKASDNYMSFILDGYEARTELYQAILETNIAVTKDALLGAGIRGNFSNAIQEVLKSNIAGKSSRSELNKAVRQAIQGTDKEKGFLQKYLKQTVNDSVQVFNAEYIQTISEDLNFEHFFYAGTLIEDSRQFCKARAGRYFTKAEVESWASLKGWNGRFAGTTKKTIFIYRGGYGCRHTIMPVSIEQYQQAQKAGTAGIK